MENCRARENTIRMISWNFLTVPRRRENSEKAIKIRFDSEVFHSTIQAGTGLSRLEGCAAINIQFHISTSLQGLNSSLCHTQFEFSTNSIHFYSHLINREYCIFIYDVWFCVCNHTSTYWINYDKLHSPHSTWNISSDLFAMLEHY